MIILPDTKNCSCRSSAWRNPVKLEGGGSFCWASLIGWAVVIPDDALMPFEKQQSGPSVVVLSRPPCPVDRTPHLWGWKTILVQKTLLRRFMHDGSARTFANCMCHCRALCCRFTPFGGLTGASTVPVSCGDWWPRGSNVQVRLNLSSCTNTVLHKQRNHHTLLSCCCWAKWATPYVYIWVTGHLELDYFVLI